MKRHQHLDEDSVRSRPPRSTRPRTRIRPAHDDAVGGIVVGVDRGRFTCVVADRTVVAMRAGDLRKTAVVVGDRVSIVGDTSGGPDALARIVRVAARTSVLRRTADDTDPIERVIVANAEMLVIVTSLAQPEPRPRLIDRYLVAAYDGGLEPLLCLTKHDLADPDDLLSRYRPLGVEAVATSSKRVGDPGVDELRARLTGRVSVLVGQSGVGKSTLVNALVPDAERATGVVSAIGKGRHTSSSVVALRLPAGGWIVDTPGIRSFGLGGVTADRLLGAFPDLAKGVTDCPRGCGHTAAEAEECGLDLAVERGDADPERLESYRRLLQSTTEPPERQ